jgi:hypothetical protein
MRRLVLTTIFLTIMGVIEASACNIVPFNFNLGTDTSTVMQVGSGKRCGVILRAGARSAFSGVAISAPARNGTVRASSSGATYQSKPGYKGADAFAFTVTGNGAFTNGSGKTTVQVSVTAQ